MPDFIRRSPVAGLLLVLACVAGSTLWFVSPLFPRAPLQALQQGSNGWLSATLLAAGSLGLLQLLVVLGPGRQRLADIGWRRGKLLPALWATLAMWLAMQAATVLASFADGQPLVWHATWERGAGVVLGALLAQVLGVALFEETVFRGYLWPQFATRLRGMRPSRAGLAAALVSSQAVFALLHLPARWLAGAAAGELAGTLLMLFLVGVVFALVYAATGNLFVAVGAHALGNAPTLLFEPQGPAPTLVLLGMLLAISLPWWWRRARADAARRTQVAPGRIGVAQSLPASRM